MTPIDLYDDVYSWKNYKEEVAHICTALDSIGVTNGSILELACGTGSYLSHFLGWERTGVDLCARSINIAQEKHKDIRFICSDMTDTGLSEQFDVILCIFGGVSYLSKERIDHAIAHWKSLLRPGGILIVEPWMEEEQIKFEAPFLFEYSCLEYSFARLVTPQKVEDSCVLDFFFLVVDSDHNLYRFQQRDVLFLYSQAWWKHTFFKNKFYLIAERDGFLNGSIVLFFQKES